MLIRVLFVLLSVSFVFADSPLIRHETECLIYASRLANQGRISATLYDSGTREETGNIVKHLADQGFFPSESVMPDQAFQVENNFGRVNTLFFSDEYGASIVMLNIDTGVWCAFIGEEVEDGIN